MSNAPPSSSKPAHGALAMLDALGFKGLWREHGHSRILDKLAEMQTRFNASVNAALNADRQALPPHYYLDRVALAFLSDTVIIGVAIRLDHMSTQDDAEGAGVALATTFSCALLQEALVSQPQFALRGCIAAGEFSIDGSHQVHAACGHRKPRPSARFIDSCLGACRSREVVSMTRSQSLRSRMVRTTR